jgi:hypothetical protein
VWQFTPTGLIYIHAKTRGGVFDAFPRFIALGVCYTLDLIESGNCVSDMGGVVDRFFALLRESEFAALKTIPLTLVDPTHSLALHFQYEDAPRTLLVPLSICMYRKKS